VFNTANLNDRRKKEMVKKLIAGALSGTLFLSAVMTEGLFSLPEIGQKRAVQSQSKVQEQYDLKATNSLGNYVNEAMREKEQVKKTSYKCVSNYNYDVGFAELDRETGLMTVFSSQPSDAFLSVVIRDDDSKNVVFMTEFEVSKGENTSNSFNIDVPVFPEFFSVDVQLFDILKTPVCDPYTINTYTRFTQEVKATDITAFDEQDVINLDDDENTNFLVLGEKTIKAETTESSNILVSADYENDQYTFDKIDDVIRSLKKGDRFFIQPTENDIIAISVDEIRIDGDRATLTGGDDTEGLFDFIKIEVKADDVSNAVVDEENIPEGMEYNGVTEGEDGEAALEYTINDSYKYMNGYIKETTKLEKEWSIGPDFVDFDSDKVKMDDPDFKKSSSKSKFNVKVEVNLKAKLKISGELSYEFYQRFLHVEFEIKFKSSASLSIEFSGKVTLTIPCPPCGWTIVPGLWVGFDPEIKVELSGKFKFSKSIGYDYVWSFDTSRDKMFSGSCTPQEEKDFEFEVEASVKITFDIKPTFYLVSKKIVHVSLEAPIGFELTVK
jgi:hypothetical protein